MPGFPFLKLPVLNQVDVAKHLDIHDLFQFSRLSTKTKNIARETTTILQDLIFSVKNYVVLLAPDTPSSVNCIVPPLVGNAEVLDPNGRMITIPVEEPTEEARTEIFWKLVIHVLGMFRNRWAKIYIQEPFDATSLASLGLSPLQLLLSGIKFSLTLNGTATQEITHQTLKFALESRATHVTVEGEVEENYSYPLKGCGIICVMMSGPTCWLDFEAILNSECEILLIHIKLDPYDNRQLNLMVKKVVRRDLKELNNFVMKTRAVGEQSVNAKLDAILEGIDAVPWDVARRETHYNGLCAEFSNGRTFFDADGTERCIYIRNTRICLYNASPNMSDLQVLL